MATTEIAAVEIATAEIATAGRTADGPATAGDGRQAIRVLTIASAILFFACTICAAPYLLSYDTLALTCLLVARHPTRFRTIPYSRSGFDSGRVYGLCAVPVERPVRGSHCDTDSVHADSAASDRFLRSGVGRCPTGNHRRSCSTTIRDVPGAPPHPLR
jgi:hypothetical protein